MAEQKQSLFREKTVQRISSPEQLTDYLRVTNPGIWVILAAVILLMAGVFVWSATGRLETTADVKVVVEDHTGTVITNGTDLPESGNTLRIASQEFVIASVSEDEYGRAVGLAEVSLPDGVYDAQVVLESVHPIQFLMESR